MYRCVEDKRERVAYESLAHICVAVGSTLYTVIRQSLHSRKGHSETLWPFQSYLPSNQYYTVVFGISPTPFSTIVGLYAY
jgi:hypothetical protein